MDIIWANKKCSKILIGKKRISCLTSSKNLILWGAEISSGREQIYHLAASKNLVWRGKKSGSAENGYRVGGSKSLFSREQIPRLERSKNLVWKGEEISFGREWISHLVGSKNLL